MLHTPSHSHEEHVLEIRNEPASVCIDLCGNVLLNSKAIDRMNKKTHPRIKVSGFTVPIRHAGKVDHLPE